MNLPSMNGWLVGAALCLGLSAQNVYAQQGDFAGHNRYAKENASLPTPSKKERRVVFLGNSITEGWVNIHPDFFKKNGYIGRGISGQTSYQFLLRFREDVIKLQPKVLVLNAGTNDVAENTGPYNEEYTYGNIVTMIELARAHKIKVILTSVLPTAQFPWRKQITDSVEKINSLNARLKAYAQANKIAYVDYYTAMVDPTTQGQQKALTQDGVHPNAAGYDVMEKLIQEVLE